MKKYIAEFAGTFAIVFFGTGAAIVNQETHGAVTHLGISATFGLAVMLMIYAFGNLSGAHFNPAVTIAFSIDRKFPADLVIPYLVSQFAGALAASLILGMLFPSNAFLGSTIPSGTEMQSLLIEILLSFFLMLAIMSIANGFKEAGKYAGAIIGLVIFLEAYFAGPVTGASMNPARSFGPAIISGHLEHLWIYFVAPVTGTIAGVCAWNLKF